MPDSYQHIKDDEIEEEDWCTKDAVVKITWRWTGPWADPVNWTRDE